MQSLYGTLRRVARRALSGRRKPGTPPPTIRSRINRDGLQLGAPAPTFSALDPDGNEHSLEDLRGRSVLLVFTAPDCLPCEALIPDLLDLASRDDPAILLVAHGPADEIRAKAAQHDFRLTTVRQPGRRISKLYGTFATPAAYVVDEEGMIVGRAIGLRAIRNLIGSIG
jgi:peroxiredoxin